MYVLDSNILIGFLRGDDKIREWVRAKMIDNRSLSISIITRIEVLSMREAGERELETIENLLATLQQVGLYDMIADIAAGIRRKEKNTLADAIVLATAVYGNSTLVTNDKILAKKAKQFVNVISIV